MREILFRGKRKDNGEWIEGGGLWTEGDSVFIITQTRYYPDTRDSDTLDYYETHPHYRPAKIAVIPETVGQFTGQLDKNGRKIFEGDLVWAMMDYGPAGFHSRMLTIGWHNDRGYQWEYFDMSTIEIMGNAYEILEKGE